MVFGLTTNPSIHLVKISNISPKTTIKIEKNKHFKAPTFDKSWIKYERSTGALAIKCREGMANE